MSGQRRGGRQFLAYGSRASHGRQMMPPLGASWYPRAYQKNDGSPEKVAAGAFSSVALARPY